MERMAEGILSQSAKWAAAIWWILFSALVAVNHARVRRRRRQERIPEDGAALRDPASMKGLAIEGLAFLLLAVLRRPAERAPEWAAAVSIMLGAASVALLWAALRHLGLEWRIKAVVTPRHRLVTTGPYRLVRHPVFAAMLLLLVSTGLLFAPWWALLLALAVYLCGTEIRVRAEDGLLARRFGERFARYRESVPAYLPFLR
jgi:protein-S-isoprenylcysteine O-methyltransferase Ste14